MFWSGVSDRFTVKRGALPFNAGYWSCPIVARESHSEIRSPDRVLLIVAKSRRPQAYRRWYLRAIPDRENTFGWRGRRRGLVKSEDRITYSIAERGAGVTWGNDA